MHGKNPYKVKIHTKGRIFRVGSQIFEGTNERSVSVIWCLEGRMNLGRDIGVILFICLYSGRPVLISERTLYPLPVPYPSPTSFPTIRNSVTLFCTPTHPDDFGTGRVCSRCFMGRNKVRECL